MAKSKDKDGGDGDKASGFGALFLVLGLLTVVAGGVGYLAGNYIRGAAGPSSALAPVAVAQPSAKISGAQVVVLPAIVTNLSGGGWVRLEVAVVADGDKPIAADLQAKLAEDVTALMRTLSLAQITPASGFQHLREELAERARTRTGGKVREISIQSMVVE